MISSTGRHSHAAWGLSGDFWIASSKYGVWEVEEDEGGDVIVKPPAPGVPGTYVSSHCPARTFDEEVG